jgi:two-component system sensor histidine kinase UhpB
MTRQLAMAAAQNRRLNERLLTLQAEERADLARDLHDEVGPLLFAVDLTAATIDRLARGAGGSEIVAHARSIQETIGRMQRHVRMLLGRLRPIEAAVLSVAIDRLAAFWRSRQPNITFVIAVSVEEDRIGHNLKETIYRIVQEGMTNAIRHGKPDRIEITVSCDDDNRVRIEVIDDGIGMSANGMRARDPGQLGLVGMYERVMAVAGSLAIRHGRDGKGLALIVELPCEQTVDISE